MYRSMVKKAVGAFLVIAAAINLSACSMQKEKVRYSKAYLEFFDTVTQIVGYEEDEETFRRTAKKYILCSRNITSSPTYIIVTKA